MVSVLRITANPFLVYFSSLCSKNEGILLDSVAMHVLHSTEIKNFQYRWKNTVIYRNNSSGFYLFSAKYVRDLSVGVDPIKFGSRILSRAFPFKYSNHGTGLLKKNF